MDTCSVDTYEAGVWWLRAAVVLFVAALSSGTALPPRDASADLPEAVAEAVPDTGRAPPPAPPTSTRAAPPAPPASNDSVRQGIPLAPRPLLRRRVQMQQLPSAVHNGVVPGAAPKPAVAPLATPDLPALAFTVGARGREGEGVAAGAPVVLRVPPAKLKRIRFKL